METSVAGPVAQPSFATAAAVPASSIAATSGNSVPSLDAGPLHRLAARARVRAAQTGLVVPSVAGTSLPPLLGGAHLLPALGRLGEVGLRPNSFQEGSRALHPHAAAVSRRSLGGPGQPLSGLSSGRAATPTTDQKGGHSMTPVKSASAVELVRPEARHPRRLTALPHAPAFHAASSLACGSAAATGISRGGGKSIRGITRSGGCSSDSAPETPPRQRDEDPVDGGLSTKGSIDAVSPVKLPKRRSGRRSKRPRNDSPVSTPNGGVVADEGMKGASSKADVALIAPSALAIATSPAKTGTRAIIRNDDVDGVHDGGGDDRGVALLEGSGDGTDAANVVNAAATAAVHEAVGEEEDEAAAWLREYGDWSAGFDDPKVEEEKDDDAAAGRIGGNGDVSADDGGLFLDLGAVAAGGDDLAAAVAAAVTAAIAGVS
eukprot:TRINITY_DN13317_c0_g1_i1.p1 TRINITY_DN13317_c0_g1~~TRINITY_DN13317_c0_g1_i1.p1  ORF type:complete len:499 (+),score=100.08 TRINITY_DN13317_c0_g1_i1:203-1498(+)